MRVERIDEWADNKKLGILPFVQEYPEFILKGSIPLVDALFYRLQYIVEYLVSMAEGNEVALKL